MKPIATSEVVRPPVNPQTKIWRYMDFTKFVAAIEHKVEEKGSGVFS
jgi:hypothetical protein